ncbi:MAG: phage holin family protein [Desulfobacteraceae bacterium]|jgi:putative membrane protein|nr:phage holin family protein [Desulfobacteraceae bacterium]
MRHIRITNFYKQSPQGNPFGKEMMGRLLIKWLCLTGAVLFAAYVLDGIYVKDFFSAIFAAAVLGILNMSFRPLLLILTLPINVMSLGFFTFIINAFMLKMASGVISGFTVTGFWTAIFGSLLISIANWILTALIQENRMYEQTSSHTRPQPPEQDDDTIDLNQKGNKWE